MEKYNPEQAPKKDSNKIYFLIVVIAALLGTNAYLFFRDKKANDKIVTITDEKARMDLEIDKIEAELDKATNANIQLTASMQEEQDLARQKISELREQLQEGKLTQSQLAKARTDIKQLKYYVSKYTSEIEDLKKSNKALAIERDSLKTTVGNVTAKASELEKQNTELNSKVEIASALKIANVKITPLRVKNSGKETDVTKASTAKKLRVTLTIADNPIASKGMHDIFMRIVDPNGNLIVSDNAGLFSLDSEELQYTYKTAIEFGNDGKTYNIDWTNPSTFQKGTYTVMLYADGHTMGKSTVTLR